MRELFSNCYFLVFNEWWGFSLLHPAEEDSIPIDLFWEVAAHYVTSVCPLSLQGKVMFIDYVMDFFFPVIRLLSWALYFFTLGVFWRSMKFRTVTHCVIFAEEWSEGIEAQILTQWHVNLHQQAHQWKCGQKMKFTGGTEQISFCPVHANPGQMKQRLQWQQTGFKVIVLEYP